MSEFDSILLRVEIGASRKLRRFTPEQRWCVVAGVWALAAKSPLRGYLLVAENVPVEVDDVAEQAGVKPAIARAALAKMRELGMLETDNEAGAEHVHDWHQHQREPKQSESREAWRERKRRQREEGRDGHAVVTGNVPRDIRDMSHPTREEKRREEKERPPLPPEGGRDRDWDSWEKEMAVWVVAHPVTDELAAAWAPVRAQLALVVDEATFRGWLEPLHLHDWAREHVVVGCGRRGQGRWLIERFGKALQASVELVLGPEVHVEIVECGCELAERAA